MNRNRFPPRDRDQETFDRVERRLERRQARKQQETRPMPLQAKSIDPDLTARLEQCDPEKPVPPDLMREFVAAHQTPLAVDAFHDLQKNTIETAECLPVGLWHELDRIMQTGPASEFSAVVRLEVDPVAWTMFRALAALGLASAVVGEMHAKAELLRAVNNEPEEA